MDACGWSRGSVSTCSFSTLIWITSSNCSSESTDARPGSGSTSTALQKCAWVKMCGHWSLRSFQQDSAVEAWDLGRVAIFHCKHASQILQLSCREMPCDAA